MTLSLTNNNILSSGLGLIFFQLPIFCRISSDLPWRATEVDNKCRAEFTELLHRKMWSLVVILRQRDHTVIVYVRCTYYHHMCVCVVICIYVFIWRPEFYGFFSRLNFTVHLL